jgi:GDPmannose 4,6-dehydratase
LQRPLPDYRSEQIIFRLKELNIYEQIKFEVIDLMDVEKLLDLLKKYKPTHFAHLGSQSSVKKSREFSELTQESNYLISKNIIESLEKYSQDTIFFFPSSATIYEGYEDKTVDENTKPLPMTNYAISKYKTQQLITTKTDLQLNTGILFSHESEYRRPNFFSKKVTEFLSNYYLGKKGCLRVGDISIKRDIGYAQEYVEAIYKMMIENQKNELILSFNKLYKLKEIIDNCLDLLDIKYEILIEDDILSYIDLKTSNKFIVSDNSEFRKYDLRGIKGNNNRIREVLNWDPKIELEEICRRMVNYEIKNN